VRALSCSPPLPMHGTPCTQNSARHSQHVTLCAPGPRLAPTVPANRAAYPTLNLCTPPPASPIRDRSRTCTETGIKDLRTTKQPSRTSSTKSLYGRQTPFSNPVWKHNHVMSRGYGAMLFKQSPRVQKTIRLMVTPVPTEMNVTFITYPVLQAMQYDYYLYQLYQFQSLQYDYYFSFISFNRHLPHYLPLAKTLSKSADTSIRSPPALRERECVVYWYSIWYPLHFHVFASLGRDSACLMSVVSCKYAHRHSQVFSFDMATHPLQCLSRATRA
jgi:hypothetical protein